MRSLVLTFPDGCEIVRMRARHPCAAGTISGTSRRLRLVQCLPHGSARGAMQEQLVKNFNDWVRLIQSEYGEMPGLHLSKRQAQRMWNFDAGTADAIFAALEAANFLRRMPNDTYIRANIAY